MQNKIVNKIDNNNKYSFTGCFIQILTNQN